MLPLIGGPLLQNVAFFDKAPHAGRAMTVDGLELRIDVLVSGDGVFVLQQGSAGFGQRIGTARKVANAVIDIVSIFLLVSPVEGETLHREQRGD